VARVKLLAAADVARVVKDVGLPSFVDGLIARMEETFRRWKELKVVPRVSFSYPWGVMEAMPASDSKLYAVKIVNGHPGNPARNLLTVAALGILADAETGYPLMVADATLLTAFRTGAACAVATKHLARRDSRVVGIIGTGAQSEFLCYAVSRVVPVEEVVFYDVDPLAMRKFEENARALGLRARAACCGREVAEKADVLITATAGKGRQKVVERGWLKPGAHVNAVGGDAPGKTELDPHILFEAKVVVELLEQALAGRADGFRLRRSCGGGLGGARVPLRAWRGRSRTSGGGRCTRSSGRSSRASSPAELACEERADGLRLRGRRGGGLGGAHLPVRARVGAGRGSRRRPPALRRPTQEPLRDLSLIAILFYGRGRPRSWTDSC